MKETRRTSLSLHMPESKHHRPLWSVASSTVFKASKPTTQRVLHSSLDGYESVHCVRTCRRCFHTNWVCPLCECNPQISQGNIIFVGFCFFKHPMFLCMFIKFIDYILFILFMTTHLKRRDEPSEGFQRSWRDPFLSVQFCSFWKVGKQTNLLPAFVREFRKTGVTSNGFGYATRAAVEVNGLCWWQMCLRRINPNLGHWER